MGLIQCVLIWNKMTIRNAKSPVQRTGLSQEYVWCDLQWVCLHVQISQQGEWVYGGSSPPGLEQLPLLIHKSPNNSQKRAHWHSNKQSAWDTFHCRYCELYTLVYCTNQHSFNLRMESSVTNTLSVTLPLNTCTCTYLVEHDSFQKIYDSGFMMNLKTDRTAL